MLFLFEPINLALKVFLALILLLAATKFSTKRSLSKLTYFDYAADTTLCTVSGNLAFNKNTYTKLYSLYDSYHINYCTSILFSFKI